MPKILAIDDKKDNLLAVSALLKSLIPDCSVITALSGIEGIKLAGTDKPDTILLDVKMPGMDGFEVCKQIRSDEKIKHIPILMLTAMTADPKSKAKGLELGANAFLNKPIDEMELVAQIKSMLRIKKAEDRLREERDVLETTRDVLVQQLEKRAKDLKSSNERLMGEIEEHKRTEESLCKIEDNLKKAQNIAHIGSWEQDLISRKGYWSEETYRIFGMKPGEVDLTFEVFLSFFHPEDRGSFIREHKNVLMDHTPLNMDCRIVRPDGSERTIHTNGDLVRDENGNPMKVVGTIQDITDKKKAAEELQKSEKNLRLFKSLVDKSNDAVYLVDPVSGAFLDVNDKACAMWGFSHDELLRMRVLDVAESMKSMDSFLNRVAGIKEGESLIFEDTQRHRDGRVFPAEISISYVTMDERPYLIAIARDVTEQKEAKEELRQRTELNQKLLDALPCVATLLKPNSREVVASNKAAKDVGALPGATCYETWGQRNNPCPWCLAPKVWETGDPQHLEVETSGVVWDAHWLPIDDDLYLHYAFDVTEKKSMEKRLQQSQKLEAIGTLAGGIAHDFNNILWPIIVQTEMAMMDITPENPLRSNMDHIMSAAMRAKDLVKQILTFSRQTTEEPQPLRVSLVVKETLKFLRASLPSTIEIDQQIDTESDTVLADPTEVHQVLMNLCTNASHAMRENGGVLHLSVSVIKADPGIIAECPELNSGEQYVKLSVRDAGPGIERTVMERMFEPYFTTKQKGEGTGMGLATVHGVVKNVGGAIAVNSEPGKGATFSVYLPKIEVGVEEKFDAGESYVKGVERVLFVDDEKSMVDAFVPMLERLGYRVTARTASLEALDLFRKKPEEFDIVITDMTMPQMTGDKLARELMEIRSDIPVILCTGYSERISEKSARGMGIKAFVTKPILMHEMADTLRKVLDGK